MNANSEKTLSRMGTSSLVFILFILFGTFCTSTKNERTMGRSY